MATPVFAVTTIIGEIAIAWQVIGRSEKPGKKGKGFYGTDSIFRGIDSPGLPVSVPNPNLGTATILPSRCPCFQINDPVHEWVTP